MISHVSCTQCKCENAEGHGCARSQWWRVRGTDCVWTSSTLKPPAYTYVDTSEIKFKVARPMRRRRRRKELQSLAKVIKVKDKAAQNVQNVLVQHRLPKQLQNFFFLFCCRFKSGFTIHKHQHVQNQPTPTHERVYARRSGPAGSEQSPSVKDSNNTTAAEWRDTLTNLFRR